MLLTHLYQYFGALLGCSATGFPAYAGFGSQASVHRFMNLNSAEVGYFIQNVGLAAASFGVATDDITVVATALETIFDVRCAQPTTVIPAQGAQLQSICEADDCALAPNATCAAYPTQFAPAMSNATTASNGTTASNSTGSSSTTGSSSPSVSSFTGAAIKVGAGIGSGIMALVAFAI